MTNDTTTTNETPILGRSLWADAWRRLWRDKLAMICLAIILTYVLIAIFAPIVVGDWKEVHNYKYSNARPGANYFLGADLFGRSVITKTFLGANTSMKVAFWANLTAIPLGMLIGVCAGFYGGRVDSTIVWIFATLTCIPSLIRLIAIKFAFQGFDKPLLGLIDLNGIGGLVIALSITSWIGTCRLVRAETMRLREADYVMASKCCGRGDFSILIKHIMPNLMHLAIINFSLGFVGVITAEVMLSYLGLGVQGLPSWGKMISDANMQLVVGRWWELAAATGAMFFIVLSWSIFGDRLRDALDPKLKNV